MRSSSRSSSTCSSKLNGSLYRRAWLSAAAKVTEVDANMPVSQPVDIALYDTFAESNADFVTLEQLIRNRFATRVVVFTWNFREDLVASALEIGAAGYLLKHLSGEELTDALEAIMRGEVTVSDAPRRRYANHDLRWPGRDAELTEREAEILALVAQGKTNAQIVELLYLSINTIKTHIRSAYRKIGATTRVEAVLWGASHGMAPDRERNFGQSTSAVDRDGLAPQADARTDATDHRPR